MKKIILAIIASLSLLIVANSCSNSIVGTEWVYKADSVFADEYLVLKFTSKNTVKVYCTDNNFIATDEPRTGTFSYNKDGIIVFSNLEYYYSFCKFIFIEAEMTSPETLEVCASIREILSNDLENEEYFTFGRKR